MKDIAPALFLIGAGGYFYWTASRPDHANPKAARFIGIALAVVGLGALIYSLITRWM